MATEDDDSSKERDGSERLQYLLNGNDSGQGRVLCVMSMA